MAAAAGPLTRSRIEAFDKTADQLLQYAVRWRAVGGHLERAAELYVARIANPNGTEWKGQAGARALEEAHTDEVSVTGGVLHASDTADIAERGADSLREARKGALEAIAAAERDDFAVGEDLSVVDNNYWTSPEQYAARLAQVQAHCDYIAHHAGRLEAENDRISTQLNAGAAQMEAMVPAAWRQPAKSDAPTSGDIGAKRGRPMPFNVGPDDTIIRNGDHNGIQAAGYGIPHPQEPPPPPDGSHLIYCYPSGDPNFWWCEGYEIGKGPYAFDSPLDLSGVA